VTADWEERNNAYLGDALAWLRGRLVALAEAAPSAQPAAPPAAPPAPVQQVSAPRPAEEPPRSFWSLVFGRSRKAEPRPVESAAVTGPVELQIAPPRVNVVRPADEAAARAAATGEAPPAHVELAQRVGLSPFEADVLLLAVAAELDPSVAPLCARVPGPGLPYPTFALALRLFENGGWDALAPNRPLRRLHLVTVDEGNGVVNGRLRADERVVNFVKGLDHLAEQLNTLRTPLAAGDGAGPTPTQGEAVDQIVRRVHSGASAAVVVNLVGADSVSKRLVAEAAAAAVGHYPIRVPITNLPGAGHDLETVIRLWERDSLLSPLALYLDGSDEIGDAGPDARGSVDRLLARARGLVFLDSREVWPNLDAAALVVDVPTPSTAEQQEAWLAVLDDDGLAASLAAQFDLDIPAIQALAREYQNDQGEMWSATLRSTRPQLDLLAQRVEPKAVAADLVVPSEVADQLDRIKEQVRFRATVHTDWGLVDRTSRGLGISALFAGESGTGKTLAAEVIAHELGLNLYRIDLSQVVSKYIGETEKNLRRLFDAAERGGTILFFDEADALFGKRSEVRDSHDRYANIEVNYLLQRMESYRGLAILATNMKAALDQAFTRRLRFIVDFPFPGPAERERIWRRAFVARLDTSGLDFARLSRLTLTGGGIQNVAVSATFAAAAAPGHPLTMGMVLAAARLEYRKLGMPVNEVDFRWDDSPAERAVPEVTGVPG
jgi:hypothetical protein